MRKSLWFFLALLIVSVGVPGAQADSLDGQQVEIDYIFPTFGTILMNLGNGTVTAAGFTVNSFGLNTYTVTDTQIVLKNVFGPVRFGPRSFNGYGLTETGSSPVTITGVTLDPATNVSGVSSSNVSSDGHTTSPHPLPAPNVLPSAADFLPAAHWAFSRMNLCLDDRVNRAPWT
jgi:hypothetical protein